MTASQPKVDFAAIVKTLPLAVFIFEGARLMYQNVASEKLQRRLLNEYRVDLLVMLRDHNKAIQEAARPGSGAVTLLTAARGEPLYVHCLPYGGRRGSPLVAMTVRELGVEREAFARRYGLSPREAEIAELVLRGHSNPEIASTLCIAQTTAKRHLTRIFDKIGVNSRTQLISRLA